MKRALFLIALLSMLATMLAVSPSWAQSATNDAGPIELTQAPPLECSDSPFGRSIRLGAEQELFLGFRGTAERQNWMLHDRLDLSTDGMALARDAAWPGSGETPGAQAQNVNWLTGTSGQFRSGSDNSQFVQVFVGNDGQLRWTLHEEGRNPLEHTISLPARDYSMLQVEAGMLSRNSDRSERMAIAGKTGAGTLTVLIVNPFQDGREPLAIWRSNMHNRGDVAALDLAVGDLNGDGFDDEIMLAIKKSNGEAELIVLRYDPDYEEGSGSNWASRLAEVTSKTGRSGTPLTVHVAAADLDGRARAAGNGPVDYRDEIIFLTDTEQRSTPGFSPDYRIEVLSLQQLPQNEDGDVIEQITELGDKTINISTSDLALAAGDIEGSGRDAILVAEKTGNTVNVRAFDAASGTPVERALFETPSSGSSLPLALAAGDLDGDGPYETVVAFRDNNGALRVSTLGYKFNPASGFGELVENRTFAALDGGRRNALAISLAIGDWDDDSLKATYGTPTGSSITCKTVQEPSIVSLIHAPPYWERLQGDRSRAAWIGESQSSSTGSETALSVSRSHAFSAFVGVGFDVEGIIAKASGEIRATAGYQYMSSRTTSSGTSIGETTTEQWTSEEGSFAVVDRTTYDCYNYQIEQDGQNIDGSMRFCEYKNATSTIYDLAEWDRNFGPNNNPQALQWVPLRRDWENLALFREAGVAQSSTAEGGEAARAIDGNFDRDFANGSVTRTASENAPWWQIDLGFSQELSSVRVWNRNNAGCGEEPCAAQLQNFYVFVSRQDMREISDDPEVLKADPRVTAYFIEQAGAVTNIQTYLENQPVFGRYVRVQLANRGYLSLAEVQVFAERQPDPDRYPIRVSDADPDDGYFTVVLYNPNTGRQEPVRQRGRLLWNGADLGILDKETIPRGNGSLGWSRVNDFEEYRITSDASEHSASVGVEMEAEVGFKGVTASKGFGYEFTGGVLTENTRSVSWGESLEIGGAVQGFPSNVNGIQLGSEQCEYGFQPYYYETSDRSSVGYQHGFVVVDYIVNMKDHLRANVGPCRMPSAPADQPMLESDLRTVAPGSSLIMTARGFSNNSQALIEMRYPGESEYRELARLRMSSAGELVFVLTTMSDDPLGEYEIRISEILNAAALAQNQVASASFTLSAEAELHQPSPPGAPILRSQPKIYLPLIIR